MRINMGSVDRGMRLLLAVVVAVLYFTKRISGTSALILGILAVIFVLTGLAGLCPLYVPFGISTRKKAKTTAPR